LRGYFLVGGQGVHEVREEVPESGKVGEDFYPCYPPFYLNSSMDFLIECLSNLSTLYTSSLTSVTP
jgi:hypothetical protein